MIKDCGETYVQDFYPHTRLGHTDKDEMKDDQTGGPSGDLWSSGSTLVSHLDGQIQSLLWWGPTDRSMGQ